MRAAQGPNASEELFSADSRGAGSTGSRADVAAYKSPQQLRTDVSKRTLRNNFIRACLDPDPVARISYSDLLKHPWLNQ